MRRHRNLFDKEETVGGGWQEMVKSTPLTVAVVLLLIAHSVYTLYIMRLAVERPVGACCGSPALTHPS